MQTRVFLVHMYPSLGTRLFAKAKEIGMVSEGYVWVMADGITADLWTSSTLIQCKGYWVLNLMYQDRTKELEDFRARGNGNSNRIIQIMLIYADMNIYGLRAYDAATAFALAIEKAGTTDFGLQKEMFLAIHQRILELLGSLYIVQTFL